jgi:SAM-dependent methyltransferase
VRPDALLDIGQPLEAAHMLTTRRFGTILLRDNVFDAIFANDVLEHIPNLKTAMSNCLRLLKPGGTFHIHVPYDLSLGAWQDPTHVRAFNENSWVYYTDWYWYMGWTEARFDCLSITFHLSKHGERLSNKGHSLGELLHMPRTIDSMRVILRKRYLSESEAAHTNVMMRRPWDETPCAS